MLATKPTIGRCHVPLSMQCTKSRVVHMTYTHVIFELSVVA